jgi:hypothetical protein
VIKKLRRKIMLKKWGWLIVLVAALVAAAASSPLWLTPLLELSKVESNRIEGLTGILQIAIWILVGIIMLIAEIRRRKRTAEANKPVTKIEKKKIETKGDVRDSVQIIGDKAKVVQTKTYIEKQVVKKPGGAGETALREAYLNRLFSACRGLSLAGIDPKAASEAESRLHLEAVYTALLTRQSEIHEQRQTRELFEKEGRLLSAVEQMNRHKRLVLFGDPGSG